MSFDVKKMPKVQGGLSKVNAASDVATYYADGFGAIVRNKSVVKVSFIEHIAGSEGMPVERFVVNIAIGKLQLRQMHGALGEILNEMESMDRVEDLGESE